MFSSASTEWVTPPEIYDPLNAVFHFETDPCTTKDNPLGTKTFYTKESNGLERPWFENTFINPPYGKEIGLWVREARRRQVGFYDYYNQRHHEIIVMLLPARTDTKWFHDYIWDSGYSIPKNGIEIRFLKGRIKFVGAKNPAPFPSMICIFKR